MLGLNSRCQLFRAKQSLNPNSNSVICYQNCQYRFGDSRYQTLFCVESIRLEDIVAKLVAKVDTDAATSAKRKKEVKELQSRWATMDKQHAIMVSIRSEENNKFSRCLAMIFAIRFMTVVQE